MERERIDRRVIQRELRIRGRAEVAVIVVSSCDGEHELLHSGEGVTIVVKKDWPDAHGVPLAAEFRHRYRVGPADQRALQTADWRIAAPPWGTREPLTITFPKPLDYGLLQRSLTVTRGSRTLVGDSSIGAGETRWEFVPRTEWEPS